MKKKSSQALQPSKLAFSAAILTATSTLFATILALMLPSMTTITPFLHTLYGTLGYNLSTNGAILGTIYSFTDIFILTWLFAWIYNKLL